MPAIVYKCPVCNLSLPHTIVPEGTGCIFTCTKCNGNSKHLTFAEMMERIKSTVTAPPFEISPDDANTVRVFVKHATSDDGEAEVPTESVQQHIRIKGAFPTVGDKLMALPRGLAHKAFAIPIGDVVRVEPVH